MRGHNYVTQRLHIQKGPCLHTQIHTHTHTLPHMHTHCHSTMLLSHSPWSHFSQSPRVCEGQSGLSSHKPGLHTPLPVKVCVCTEGHMTRRNRKARNDRTEMILQYNVVQDPVTLPIKSPVSLEMLD